MTEFAEVVYESGDKSVCSCDNRDELFAGLAEQHRRAISGEQGGPSGIPAVRVVKVLFYDDHPGTYHESGEAPSDEVLAGVTDYLKAIGPVVNVNQLAAYIRDYSNAVATVEHPHDSQFKAPEKETVAAGDFLNPETGAVKKGGK